MKPPWSSGGQPADAELVARARKGDGAGFDALVRRHYRAAYAVALAVLGRRDDAEDICQEAWIRVLERIDDCRDPSRFVYWMLQIVRNRARNHLAYRKVRHASSLEETPEHAAPTTAGSDVLLRGRLEAALGELTEVQREVVLLHDLEGFEHREIGESLGISEVMSRQHLFRARQQLRGILGERARDDLRIGREE
ncbi:MAG: RNA polymerase sigma factor [Candidatus Eisenbacteria bacterium]|nr:RNA polymerase sigma factor [Candidatus Eisenbacteria bacterium]MCC7140881.1 RNA polymerase sigma factor [Candidatus Eisenbacteria bacterium]